MLDGLLVLISRVRGLFSDQKLERDFDQEVQSHLAMLADENIRRGMTPEEARCAAVRRFGGIAQIKEDQRERRGMPQIETFLKDLRYAARTLLKSPGFTIVAIFTLALGIGVNTTLFTAFNAIALKPLPVKDADAVIRLERWFETGSHGDIQYAFSYPEYIYYREQNRVFSSLVAVSWPIRVSASIEAGEPEPVHGQLVSENYFSDFGIAPILGRTFLPEEGRTPGAHPVMVLSHTFWEQRFRSDPQAAGKIVKLNDTAFTIIGVAPPEFVGTGVPPVVPDFWAPLMMQAQVAPAGNWLDSPSDYQLQILARPLPGIRAKQAQAEMNVVANQFAQAHPQRYKTLTVTLPPARFWANTDDIRFQAFVALMMGVVGLVLLIACANLANMLLARSAGR